MRNWFSVRTTWNVRGDARFGAGRSWLVAARLCCCSQRRTTKKRKEKGTRNTKKKKEMMKWTHPFRVPDTAGRSMFRNQPLISKSALSVDSDLFRGRSGEKQNKTKQKKQKTITKIKSKSNESVRKHKNGVKKHKKNDKKRTVNPFFQRNRIIIFFRRL